MRDFRTEKSVIETLIDIFVVLFRRLFRR